MVVQFHRLFCNCDLHSALAISTASETYFMIGRLRLQILYWSPVNPWILLQFVLCQSLSEGIFMALDDKHKTSHVLNKDRVGYTPYWKTRSSHMHLEKWIHEIQGSKEGWESNSCYLQPAYSMKLLSEYTQEQQQCSCTKQNMHVVVPGQSTQNNKLIKTRPERSLLRPAKQQSREYK